MAEYTHVGPGLPPLHGAQANALILGSFPSPKSREQGFFYGHKQNRFWPMIAAVTGEPVPDWADIEAKKAIILKHGLAVWDTIGACDIKGASDASIRNAVPNDVAALIQKLGVQAVFCNGAASGRIYAKYAEPLTHLPAAVLPSTCLLYTSCQTGPQQYRDGTFSGTALAGADHDTLCVHVGSSPQLH